MQKLADAERQVDSLGQKVQPARSHLDRLTLRSPADGTVQASTITTVGQVVTTGQELMRIVPSDSAIEVLAYLPNEESGFVRLGQEATVKVAAFPFSQYGTVPAKIVRLGKDAVSAADAQQTLTDPSRPAYTSGRSGSAEATASLVLSIGAGSRRRSAL